jgi:nitrous oxidase accessory protein NosD
MLVRVRQPAASAPASPSDLDEPRTPQYGPDLPEKVPLPPDLPAPDLKPFPDPVRSGPEIRIDSPNACLADVIDDAPEGATLLLPPGKYIESITIGKSLNFVGIGKVSISANGAEDTVTVTGGFVTFEGISIKHLGPHAKPAFSIHSGCASFTNCKIRSANATAIFVDGDVQLRLLNSQLIGSTLPALSLTQTAELIAEGCLFRDSEVFAVVSKARSKSHFTQCRFANCRRGAILSIDDSRVFVDSCAFTESTIEIESTSQAVISGSQVFHRIHSGIIAGKTSTVFVTGTSFDSPEFTGMETRPRLSRRSSVRSSPIVAADSQSPGLETRSLLGLRSQSSVRGSPIVCSETHFIGLEGRGESTIKSSHNHFRNAALVLWGSSKADSANDSFTGDSNFAVSLKQNAVLNINDFELSNLGGCGFVANDETVLNVQNGSIYNARKSGIVAQVGPQIAVTDTTISECGECGLLITRVSQLSLTRVAVSKSGKSGGELNFIENLSIQNSTFNENGECGLLISRSRPVITECEFHENALSGIHLGERSAAEVQECKFVENIKCGILVRSSSRATLLRPSFTGNHWTAAFVEVGSNLVLRDGEFNANQLGLAVEGTAAVETTKFRGHGGAAVQISGTAEFAKLTFKDETNCAIVQGGTLKLTDSSFSNCQTCIAATKGASVTASNCDFVETQGLYSVHIANSIVAVQNCCFLQNADVSIFCQGELRVSNSTFSGGSANGSRAAIVFDEGSGQITKNKFTIKAMCSIEVDSGAPEIADNTIAGETKYGIFLGLPAAPRVFENTFQGTHQLRVWRERANEPPSPGHSRQMQTDHV